MSAPLRTGKYSYVRRVHQFDPAFVAGTALRLDSSCSALLHLRSSLLLACWNLRFRSLSLAVRYDCRGFWWSPVFDIGIVTSGLRWFGRIICCRKWWIPTYGRVGSFFFVTARGECVSAFGRSDGRLFIPDSTVREFALKGWRIPGCCFVLGSRSSARLTVLAVGSSTRSRVSFMSVHLWLYAVHSSGLAQKVDIGALATSSAEFMVAVLPASSSPLRSPSGSSLLY